jgi:uncharacterized lipoprotein YddW (UPF0748 family)
LAYFRRATGQTPDSAPHKWNQWRTSQITQIVREIRAMMRRVRPGAKLTAAVGPVPQEARRKHFQDVRAWLNEGLLDAVYPMNYAPDMPTFRKRLSEWVAMRPRIPVVTGIMFDKRDGAIVVEQVRRVRQSTKHFSAFAYNSLFERRDARGRRAMDEQSGHRAALRKHAIPALRRFAVAQSRDGRANRMR